MYECWWFEKCLGKVIEMTPHARMRQAEREITDTEIVRTLKNGYQQPGTNRRCLGDIAVAFKSYHSTITVITVFRLEY